LTNNVNLVDTLTFTAGVLADRYDVYYLQYGGGSALTATATGGAAVPVSCNGASLVKRITVVAAAASTANTVVIRSTVGQIFIVGVEPYLSTSQVLVGNAGVSGATGASWTASPASGIDSLGAITGYAPDLTILSLGINDAGNSVPSATEVVNLTTIITTAKLSGDVILMTMPPSLGAPWTTFEPQYVAAYAALATSTGCGFVDIFTRWGGTYSAGYMSDSYHPNDAGYTDMALALADYLTL
jgi:lysophospholipase L1-like esterase